MIKRIHVIVNPASGQDRPVLSTLNTAFHDSGIDWDVSITKKAGDATEQARQAAAGGVDAVAVYGGDGTITEAIGGLFGTEVPLVILPGGTANAIALSLNIPMNLADACALATEDKHVVHTTDVGQIGDRYFLIAVGMGIAGALAEGADRQAKDNLGPLAYARSVLQALANSQVARYHITLDGKEFDCEGVTCVVANSGNFGIPGISLASSIKMDDGLLDVLVIRNTDINSVLAMAASLVRQNEESAPFEHWQGREVSVVADPEQAVQADGEVLDPGPVTARLIPHAAHIVVPRPAE